MVKQIEKHMLEAQQPLAPQDMILPEWVRPQCAVAVAPNSVTPVKFTSASGGSTRVTLETLKVGQLIVLCNDPEGLAQYRRAHAEAIAFESKSF